MKGRKEKITSSLISRRNEGMKEGRKEGRKDESKDRRKEG